MRLPVQKRLELLFDDGEYQRIDLPKPDPDPLKFRDRKRYRTACGVPGGDRRGGRDVVAHGQIGGHPVVIAAFNFEFMGGSMGVRGWRWTDGRCTPGGAAAGYAHRRSCLRRRPHAGGHPLADADAEDDHRR